MLKAAQGYDLEALYVFAVFGGLRWGELVGLSGDDVDSGTGVVFVRRLATSRRRVDLPPRR